MKTMTLKWMIGIMTIMFVLATGALADGRKGGDRGHHGPKYKQGYHQKHGGRHYTQPRHYKKQQRVRRYYAHRPHHRQYAKRRVVEIHPNPLFWLFPFPPLTPFTVD